MKTESLKMLDKDPQKVQTMLTEIDQEISTLSDYLVNLNNFIQELKKDREELVSFMHRSKNKKEIQTPHYSGEYFYG